MDLQNPDAGPGLPATAEPATPGGQTAAAERWAQRIGMIVFVIFCLELGIVLIILPWRPIWTSSYLVNFYPPLRDFLNLNAVRGAVTGLGVIDVWLGIGTAMNYRENH